MVGIMMSSSSFSGGAGAILEVLAAIATTRLRSQKMFQRECGEEKEERVSF